MRLLRPILILLGAAGVAGCLDDAPLAPSTRPARLALAAAVSASGSALQSLTMEVQVSYRGYGQTESSPVLLHARIPIADALTRSVELAVDLTPCLRDTLRATLGPACETWIDYRLADDTGLIVDQQYTGPYLLTAGRRTTPDPVTLTVGTNVPVMDSMRAVLVDPFIVRYVPAASDLDQNLRGFRVTYSDTSTYDFWDQALPGYFGSFQGPLYAFLPTPSQGSTTALLMVQAYDSKYAASADLALTPILPGNSTPQLTMAGGMIVDDQVRIDFSIADPDGDAEAVEVLFRDPALASSDPGSDTLLGRCVRPLGITTGATPVFTSVTCVLTLPLSAVEVIVVPVQKNLDVGTAGRTNISVANPPAAVRLR
jgi:hypothetical protein